MKKFDQIFEKLKVLSKLQLFIMRSIADKFLCIILKEILSTQLLIRSYYLQRRTMSNCNFFERVRYIDNSIFRMIKIQATTFLIFRLERTLEVTCMWSVYLCENIFAWSKIREVTYDPSILVLSLDTIRFRFIQMVFT